MRGVRGVRGVGARPAAAAVAAAIAAAAVVALGGCKPEPEPLFSATCGPDESNQRVKCTIRNHGKKEGRACIRARVTLEEGPPLIGRRICTRVLGPDQAAEVPALFEQMGRVPIGELLQSQCASTGRWTCKVDVLETSREMMENQPRER